MHARESTGPSRSQRGRDSPIPSYGTTSRHTLLFRSVRQTPTGAASPPTPHHRGECPHNNYVRLSAALTHNRPSQVKGKAADFLFTQDNTRSLVGTKMSPPGWNLFNLLGATAYPYNVAVRGRANDMPAAAQYSTWASLLNAAKYWDTLFYSLGYKQEVCSNEAKRLEPFFMDIESAPRGSKFASKMTAFCDKTFRAMLTEAAGIFHLAMRQTSTLAPFPFNGESLVDPVTSKYVLALKRKRDVLNTKEQLAELDSGSDNGDGEFGKQLLGLKRKLAEMEGKSGKKAREENGGARKRGKGAKGQGRGNKAAAKDDKLKPEDKAGQDDEFTFFDGFSYREGKLLVFGPKSNRLAVDVHELAEDFGLSPAARDKLCWIKLVSKFGRGPRWKCVCHAWETGACSDDAHKSNSSAAHTFKPGWAEKADKKIKKHADFR